MIVQKPLISIITVCRNAVEFIEGCVRSVTAGMTDACEYIVIDGGSTDGTVDVLERYSDSFAYWHSKPDRGIADAFNLAVGRASGEWLLFLNADDVLAGPEVLESAGNHLRSSADADVVYGQICTMTRHADTPAVVGGPYGGPFMWRRMRRFNVIPHQAAFTARAYFQEVGLFDASYSNAMDYEHYLRKGPALKAVFMPVLLSYQRMGGRSFESFARTLREYERAQIAWRRRTPVVARVDRIYLTLRHRIGLVVRARSNGTRRPQC